MNATMNQMVPVGSTSLLTRLGRLIAPFSGLMLVLLIFSILEPSSFLSVSNFRTIAVHTVVVGIGAIGMTFVIVSGGIDLSIGSVIALASVVAALVLDLDPTPGPTVALLAGAGVGVVCGLLNGVLITSLRIAPFIVTLGMLGIARGLGKYLAGNQRVAPPADSIGWLEWFMTKKPDPEWLGMAPGAWLLLGIAVLAAIVLRRTAFGVHVYAIGSNESTARLCGVPVALTKVAVYTLCGLAAGLIGVTQLGRLSVGDPTTAVGEELKIIAAAVIGGASLAGGEGSILGAMIGAFMLTTLAAGCNLAGIDNSIQEIIIGTIIVVAVTIDSLRHRRGN